MIDLQNILSSYLVNHFNISKIIALSGWGQSPNFLSITDIKINNKINYLDYSSLYIDDLHKKLQNENPDIVIGWSLGGQIAIDAIISKKINPKLLILLATPFKFLSNKSYNDGVDIDIYLSFRKFLTINPEKSLKKFHLMMLQFDDRFKSLKNNYLYNINFSNLQYWLDYLVNFSGFEKNFDDFCQTILIYGKNDQIVNIRQGELFLDKIKNSTLKIINNYSHIPFNNISKP